MTDSPKDLCAYIVDKGRCNGSGTSKYVRNKLNDSRVTAVVEKTWTAGGERKSKRDSYRLDPDGEEFVGCTEDITHTVFFDYKVVGCTKL